MRKNLVLTPLMAFIASGGAMVAQDLTSAILQGRVVSADGAPLAGVRVLLESPALLVARSAVTDSNGQFRVTLLPNGSFSVTYSLNGYITRKQTLQLIAGQTANGSARLTPINVAEATVEITGGAAQIDKTDTVVQTAFSGEFLKQMMNADNLGSLGALMPGVNSNSLNDPVRVRGGTSRSTKFLINGQNSTESFGGYAWGTSRPLQDLIESVALMQSPTNARYGNSDSGLISMVTSKGTNDFRGTFRVQGLRRDFWRTYNAYPARNGDVANINPPDDTLGKDFEFTIQGPIWKEHITFAYGGKLARPEITPTWWQDTNVGWWTQNGERPQDKVGIFYQAPNGATIRRAELRELQDPNNRYGDSYKYTYNHLTLFAQINPNHQFEYGYREENSAWGPQAGGRWMGVLMDDDSYDEPARWWTMAYKGIIGTSGVLDVRHGKQYTAWRTGGSGRRASVVYVIPSVVPISGTYDKDDIWRIGNYSNNDLSNFVASGYLDAALSTGGGSADYWFDGMDDGGWDGGGTTSTQLNYQHFLSTAKGNHIIDVGFQQDKFTWQLKAGGPTEVFRSPGQVPFDLRMQDVYNPNGAPINLADYAGKYIVWNLDVATFGSVDPYGTAKHINDSRMNGITADTLLFTGSGIRSPWTGNLNPRYTRRFGEGTGEYSSQQASFYINDMWTINDSHSVMAGLRFDMFKLWDAAISNIHSYTKPTFRLEYKWDLKGDQSRLINVSYSQFHNFQYGALFSKYVNVFLPNREERYWNKPAPAGYAPGQPYLVSYEEWSNPDNYGILYNTVRTAADTAQIDPDWQSPTVNEFSIGFARNLTHGGSLKVTFINRSWQNLWDIFPGERYQLPNGNGQAKLLLKNTSEFERRYNSIEVEWDLPLAKRLNFGGNYTYARLMSNEGGYSAGDFIRESTVVSYNTYQHWDAMFADMGGRAAWAPVLLGDREHNFKFFFIYDLSLGKAKSSVALRGQWQSAKYASHSYSYLVGLPIIPGVNNFNGGGTGQTTTGLSDSRNIPFNRYTENDEWGTNLRYNLDMLLVRKLLWFVTVDMSNPFNHRGYSGWAQPGGPSAGSIVLNETVNASGTVTNRVNNPYDTVPWSYWGNCNGSYRGRMGGRSISLQTGLRF